MAALQVQYATTEDGVQLAYSTAGQGRPLIVLPNESLSMTGRWDIPQIVSFYERLGRGRRLVTYDRRGYGLSDRADVAPGFELAVADVLSVADELQVETFDVFGARDGISIVLAATHTDRVRRLVLWDPVTNMDELLAGPVLEMGRRMIEGDWKTYWESMLKMLDLPAEYAGVWEQSISQDNYRRMYESGVGVDITPLLGSIASETLVLGYPEGAYSPRGAARDVSARIEHARLVQLAGAPYVPWQSETIDEVLDAAATFLDEGARSEGAGLRGFQTILFTDLEASTR